MFPTAWIATGWFNRCHFVPCISYTLTAKYRELYRFKFDFFFFFCILHRFVYFHQEALNVSLFLFVSWLLCLLLGILFPVLNVWVPWGRSFHSELPGSHPGGHGAGIFTDKLRELQSQGLLNRFTVRSEGKERWGELTHPPRILQHTTPCYLCSISLAHRWYGCNNQR